VDEPLVQVVGQPGAVDEPLVEVDGQPERWTSLSSSSSEGPKRSSGNDTTAANRPQLVVAYQ
jgi:hypothetical protein